MLLSISRLPAQDGQHAPANNAANFFSESVDFLWNKQHDLFYVLAAAFVRIDEMMLQGLAQ